MNAPAPTPNATKTCVHCGSRNQEKAQQCWLCEQPLPTNESAAEANSRLSSTISSHVETSGLLRWEIQWGWSLSAAVFVFFILIIGVGIGSEWPALLIPYGLVMALVLVAITRVLQLNFRALKDEHASERPLASAIATVATGAVLGVSALFGVIIVLALVAVPVGVIFFIICLALVESGTLFH